MLLAIATCRLILGSYQDLQPAIVPFPLLCFLLLQFAGLSSLTFCNSLQLQIIGFFRGAFCNLQAFANIFGRLPKLQIKSFSGNFLQLQFASLFWVVFCHCKQLQIAGLFYGVFCDCYLLHVTANFEPFSGSFLQPLAPYSTL